MTFRNQWNGGARKMLVGGMFALAIASAWPRFIHRVFNLTPDVIDLTHGLWLGLAIGLMLMALRRNNQQDCQG